MQGRWLQSVVRGHMAYYAVPGNNDAVNDSRHQVTWHWYQALRRRGHRTRITWARIGGLPERDHAAAAAHHAPEIELGEVFTGWPLRSRLISLASRACGAR